MIVSAYDNITMQKINIPPKSHEKTLFVLCDLVYYYTEKYYLCSKMHYYASLIFDTLILPNRISATNHRPDFRLVVFLYPFSKKGGKTMEKSTMSVQELSAQLGISLVKAYELVKTPGFPTLRIGTRILIPVDAYKAWLMQCATKQ